MDIYEEIRIKRAERFERRAARARRDERFERIIRPIRLLVQTVLGGIILYAALFAGALWASM